MEFFEYLNSLNSTQGALIGALGGATLTGFYNLFIKGVEYRNAAYGKLVEQRIKAYQELEAVLIPFNKVIVDVDKSHLQIQSMMVEGNYLDAFAAVKSFQIRKRWLRRRTQKKLIAFVQQLDIIELELERVDGKQAGGFLLEKAKPLHNRLYSLLDSIQLDYPFLHEFEHPMVTRLYGFWDASWNKLFRSDQSLADEDGVYRVYLSGNQEADPSTLLTPSEHQIPGPELPQTQQSDPPLD